MNSMNLHHLRYFMVIADEGSLSGASKKLLVGQPALSAQLKQFEDWLGFNLFDRVGKKLIITSRGEYVLKYAKAIRSVEEELIANLSHAGEISKREIIVGAQESVPKSILADAISRINSERQLKVKVLEGTGDELFHLLLGHKIDFFIGNFRPMNESKEMLYLSLGKEVVSVWGSKKFLSLKKGFPASLDQASFVLAGFQNQLRHDFERFMLQTGLDFDVPIEAQDTALLKEFAVRGEGLVLLGDESAASWAKAGQLQKIGTLNGVKEEYWLGMVKKNLDNELIRRMMKDF